MLLLSCSDQTSLIIQLKKTKSLQKLKVLEANLGIHDFIKRTPYLKIHKHSGSKNSNHATDVGDVHELESWMRAVIVDKMLVQSTPYYANIGSSSGSRTGSNSTSPTRRQLPDTNTGTSTTFSTTSSEIMTKEFYGKYLLLWGVRFRQLRVSPVNRTSNNNLLEHACLVHRKTNENFYDIDYSMNPFGAQTFGWLTSTCYPEWSNVLSTFIETVKRFTPLISASDAMSIYNYSYYEPENTDFKFQNTLYNSYPPRGWVSDFLLNDENVLSKFDKTMSNGKFIDEQTRAVVIEFTTYLPTTGTFSSVKIIFETHIAGGLIFTPVVTSTTFNSLTTVSTLRIVTGVLLTIINIYNIYHGFSTFIDHAFYKANSDFVIYGWDLIEIINEGLMMSLVFSLWNEMFIEEHYKILKKLLNTKGEFVDTTTLFRRRREDITTFAVNAFLVSIRFAQFFKLSRELKFVWLAVKQAINNVGRFLLYVMLPCLLGSVSSAYVAFGPHLLTISNFGKAFAATLRLTFRDDSFVTFYSKMKTSAISNGLVALFLFSIALLYSVVLFSFLQAIIFESWQSLLFQVQGDKKERYAKNEAYFTRYLKGKLHGLLSMCTRVVKVCLYAILTIP